MAVSDQLLSVRVAPVAFAVSGFPVPPLFSIPAEIDLAPNQPVSRVSANSCCFPSQAPDALAVQVDAIRSKCRTHAATQRQARGRTICPA